MSITSGGLESESLWGFSVSRFCSGEKRTVEREEDRLEAGWDTFSLENEVD